MMCPLHKPLSTVGTDVSEQSISIQALNAPR